MMNAQTPELHEVFGVTATKETGVVIVNCDITDIYGERYRCEYVSAPDDQYGLAPTIRQWLQEHQSEYVVAPYQPPTAEQRRTAMPAITRRQLRLALVRNGISIATVDSAIAGMPEGQDKEEATIEWQDGTTFERLHPTLLFVAGALSLSPEDVDAMWSQALAI